MGPGKPGAMCSAAGSCNKRIEPVPRWKGPGGHGFLETGETGGLLLRRDMPTDVHVDMETAG